MRANAPVRRGLRIGFCSSFYPLMSRTGGGSTGTALLLSTSPRVKEVVVFGPDVARLPPGAPVDRLTLRPIWRPDDLWSLVRLGWELWRASARLDGYIFSLSITTFGRRSLTNACGLLLPVLLRRISGRPVVVFIHNFLETQHLDRLGYAPTRSTRWAASYLERIIIRETTTVVGLASQRAVVEAALGGTVHCIPMRFAEMVHPWFAGEASGGAPRERAHGGPLRVLLLGFWGPQKDLKGALATLERLRTEGVALEVTVAGEAHPDFPSYAAELAELQRTLPSEAFHFPGFVPNEHLRALFDRHDVLVLPYNTTGGYSGVLNLACGFELPVVAYDLPELRENASILGARPAFVRPGDVEGFRAAFQQIRTDPSRPRRHSLFDDGPGGAGAQECVEDLIRLAVGEPVPSSRSPTDVDPPDRPPAVERPGPRTPAGMVPTAEPLG